MIRITDEKFFQTIHDFFEVYLSKMRHCSDNTIRSYRGTISSFLDYVSEVNNLPLAKLSFSLIDSKVIASYLEKIENSGVSIATRNQRLQAIRSFFAYVALSDPSYMIYKSEVDKIPAKKNTEEKTIDYLSEDAIKILFEQPDQTTDKGLRDLFLMIVMYDSAARVQEIVNICIADINDGDTPTLILHGKGNKTRIVPLMKSTMKYFEMYMKVYHPNITDNSEKPLFYSKHTKVQHKLDTSTVRKMLNQYGDTARESYPAMPKNIHPHLLRHSRAMHLYQHGMDLTLISQWLGHAQLETTLIYAHADTEQKRKAIEQATTSNGILGTKKSVDRYTIDDDETIRRLYGLK